MIHKHHRFSAKRLFLFIISFSIPSVIFLNNLNSSYIHQKIRDEEQGWGANPRQLYQHENLIDKYKCDPIINFNLQYFVNINNEQYPKSVPLFYNKSIDFDCLNKNERIKKILFWNKFFGSDSFLLGLGERTPFIKQHCPVTNCELLSNKSRLNESDYVVVHMRDTIDQLPDYRPPEQKWVFLLYESPYYNPDIGKYNNYFNLTSTYSHKSDFPGFFEHYSHFYWVENKFFNEKFNFHGTKKGFAVALVSKCLDNNGRLSYIEELKRYVPVDLFGKCGLNVSVAYPDTAHYNVKRKLSEEYKFFLSFENSNCDEYITEKFFQILQYNIIPVVMGGGPYDHYVS